MLFLNIYTYKEGKREETSSRFATGIGQATMTTTDDRGVEANDIHQVAEAEEFTGKPAGNFELRKPQGRIEEQFNRVITGFPVYVNTSCKV